MLPLPPCRSLVPSLCETIRTSYAIGAYSRLLMHSPSCTSARPVRSPATHALPRPSSLGERCRPARGRVSPRGDNTPRPTSTAVLTCTGARYHTVQDARWLWAHQAPEQAGWSSAHSHRNSTERWQEAAGLEARWKHFGSILASEIRVRTCAHQLWYWPPLDSAGIPFFSLSLFRWCTHPPFFSPMALSHRHPCPTVA